jgi:hypothetical protein
VKRAASLCLALVASALPLSPTATARTDVRQVRVQFPKGRSGTTIQGSIRGAETVDYTLRAAAGQAMKVRLEPGTVYFNVLPPGSNDVALFVGSRESRTGRRSRDGLRAASSADCARRTGALTLPDTRRYRGPRESRACTSW